MLKLVTDENGKRRIVGESDGHLAAADAIAKRGRKVGTREHLRRIPAVDGTTVQGSERWKHSAHVSNPPMLITTADGRRRWVRLKRTDRHPDAREMAKSRPGRSKAGAAAQRQQRDIALMARMGTIHEQH